MKKHWAQILTFLKFSGCTFIAYLVDMGIFALGYEVFHWDYLAAKACSYLAGVITSYSLNRIVTFQAKSRYVSGTLLRFLGLNCVSLSVSLGSLYLFADIFHLAVWAGYFLSGVCSFTTNYLGNRFWVFRKRKGEKSC